MSAPSRATGESPVQLTMESAAPELSPRGTTLRQLALAGLALYACPDDASADEHPELAYLIEMADAIDSRREDWVDLVRATIDEPALRDAPLIAISRSFGLSNLELLAVVLAEAVEDDPMIGRVIAYLQTPVGGSRPTVGLLGAAFAALLGPDERASDLLGGGAAAACGLLTIPAEGGPLPERPLAVPLHACLALHGRDAVPAGTSLSALAAHDVMLPTSMRELAQGHARALEGTDRRVLVIRSGSSVEARAVAHAVAASLHRRPLFIEAERVSGLAPLLELRALVPVFCFELAPGERKSLPEIALYSGPSLAICGLEGTMDPGSAPVAHWTLPVPAMPERQRLWAAALDEGDATGELAAGLARNHRHGAGRIAQLGRLARHRAALGGRTQVSNDDVATASWTVEGGGLDALAQPLTDAIPDEAFVTTPALREEMAHLLLRCRVRDGLTTGLGASAIARYRPGVRALFVGPSGTGKTLAAAWLATRLGIPLYRVDLAAVTSKYIGETEKNLAQLLARAEQAEIVLLFDEADSLFGKRTDVKDSNDRFANAQTNYLLQRIETFEGIALLTSNGRSRFDASFARRLDAIVDFPLPGPEERRALWQAHLGTGHTLKPRELNLLAARIDVAGGHIRNTVLGAAVLAHAEERLIGWTDVVRALTGEYRKLGKQVPADVQLAGDD